MAEWTFRLATNYVKHMPKSEEGTIDNDARLSFYQYFKQATVGDCCNPKPSVFQPKESAKWTAWNSIKGMSKEVAMEKYVAELDSRQSNWKEVAEKHNITTLM
ncbi:acyl-coa-binding protein [Cardiosporidium cionae]|uniref:Acyl-coa-binding protein n=1 Tax=Cardiosporidium cionae TaxID=476202 RepID=A0A3Q8UBC5_9APIC|nr:enyol-CoA hydratase [Cardiosporidium cionae]AZL94186.1 enyol-CoA hydratase [Cardiosporidium cionae]KAF8820878.1 acyl-coa-binding protein [Cardiosporidium cionae]|eukprot:KAF8820878.1 acyl-coa-binding protein [Cardiosporidium cionae]